MSAPMAPTSSEAPALPTPSTAATATAAAPKGAPAQVITDASLPTGAKSLSLAEQVQRLGKAEASPVQSTSAKPQRGRSSTATAAGPKKKRSLYEPLVDAEERIIMREIYAITPEPQGPTRRYFAKLLLREKRRRASVTQFNLDDLLDASLSSMNKTTGTLSTYHPDIYMTAAAAAAAKQRALAETTPMRITPISEPKTPALMDIDSISLLSVRQTAAPSSPALAVTPTPMQAHASAPTPATAETAVRVASVAPTASLLAHPTPTLNATPVASAAPSLIATPQPPPSPTPPPPAAAAIVKKPIMKDDSPAPRSQVPPTVAAVAAASPAPLLPTPPPIVKEPPPAEPPMVKQQQAMPQPILSEQPRRFAPASPPSYVKPSAVVVHHPAPKPPPTVTAKPPPLPMAVSESPRTDARHIAAATTQPLAQPRMLFKDFLSGKHAAQQMMQPLVSKFTERTLKPYLRRDFETVPPQLAVLRDLRQAFRKRKLGPELPDHEADSIDYCYLRPSYLPAANGLLRMLFWPGIDISEWLDLPELSIVVLYRRLVIGCAVVSTEGYISYIAVHPQWRGCGIGRYMLYHLIMACPNRDITLHVSANNEAMMLYQRFGFKPEQFVRDFYDKYLPNDSKQCRHAFFLRLRR